MANWIKMDGEEKPKVSQPQDRWKKRNFWILFGQTMVMFLTLLAAVKIGCRQNEINQALLDLTSQPSMEVIFRTDHIYLRNMARTNLSLWGFKREDKEIEWMKPGPALLPPGSTLTMPVHKDFQESIRRKLTEVEEVRLMYEFYLEHADNEKWVQEVLVAHKLENGKWKPGTRTIRVYPHDWSEF